MKSKVNDGVKIYFNDLYFRPVIHADVQQLETIMKTEKMKHAHWVSLDPEFVRFAPVLKPMLFIHDDNSIENQYKEIRIVFKKIHTDVIE